MKLKNKKNILIALISLIIIAGIAVVAVYGFNKELKFEQGQSFDIYVGQTVERSEIKEILNEFLGTNNIVQEIEIYKDMVTIKANTISAEQKDNIINKLKEKYEFEQTAEETTIDTVPETRIRDIFKKYIITIVISEIAVLIYMIIRYYKKGILKVIARTAGIPLVGEMLLLSVIAITRIPVGRITLLLVIAMYIMTTIFAIKENEK